MLVLPSLTFHLQTCFGISFTSCSEILGSLFQHQIASGFRLSWNSDGTHSLVIAFCLLCIAVSLYFIFESHLSSQLISLDKDILQIAHLIYLIGNLNSNNTGWSSQKCCPATLLLSAKNEGSPTTSKLLHINLPWWCRNKFDSNKTYLSIFNSFIMTEHWQKQRKRLPCHITVECHTMKMHQPPQNTCKYAFPDRYRISLDQVKYTYPCLTAFIMTEHWLKQPKMLYIPSYLSFVECQKWRCSNYHKTFVKMSSMTNLGMSLDQIKHSYPCLTYFIMTQHWLKQPKMLPSHIVVECQNWRCSNNHKTAFIQTFPDWCRNESGSNKTYVSMFNSFY